MFPLETYVTTCLHTHTETHTTQHEPRQTLTWAPTNMNARSHHKLQQVSQLHIAYVENKHYTYHISDMFHNIHIAYVEKQTLPDSGAVFYVCCGGSV